MENSKVMIGTEEWTVRYMPQIRTPKEGKYIAAARVPSKKEVWLSLNDKRGNKLPTEKVTAAFQKAILPLIIEAKKKEFGEGRVNAAVSELGIKV